MVVVVVVAVVAAVVVGIVDVGNAVSVVFLFSSRCKNNIVDSE